MSKTEACSLCFGFVARCWLYFGCILVCGFVFHFIFFSLFDFSYTAKYLCTVLNRNSTSLHLPFSCVLLQLVGFGFFRKEKKKKREGRENDDDTLLRKYKELKANR